MRPETQKRERFTNEEFALNVTVHAYKKKSGKGQKKDGRKNRR